MQLNRFIEGGGGAGGAADGVTGPASSTDNALVRWDGTGGDTLQDGAATLSDAGVFSLTGQLNLDNLRLDGNTLSSTNSNGDINLDPDGSGNVAITSGNLTLAASATVDGVDISAAFPGSSTDNALVRWDGTTGKIVQDSGLTLSDVSGANITAATSAGTALTVNVTAATAANGASQAGLALTLTASNATASLDTAGAAAGGAVAITAGNAARLTSGNANGGDITLAPGTGIGTGTAGNLIVSRGQVVVPDGDLTTTGFRWSSAAANTGWRGNGATNLDFCTGGVVRFNFNNTAITATNGASMLNSVASSTQPALLPLASDADTGIGRAGADQLSLIAGGAEGARVDLSATATHTRLLIYDVDNATLERVTVGAADSGGAGFKVLRIPN